MEIRKENKDMYQITNSKVVILTSIEVAEMISKRHTDLMRDIRRYSEQLNESKIALVDFFIENTYVDAKGETRPCYNVTKKGCEFIAHKLTGTKGTEFTAKYINRFHDMEEQLTQPKLPTTYKKALIQLLEEVERNEQLEEERKVLLPKADYHDNVLNKKDLLTTTMVAKDLGLKSARKLNNILHNNKIIFRDTHGTWYPYAKYKWLIEDGYTDYQSYTDENVKPCLKWTEKGRKWIIENIRGWL